MFYFSIDDIIVLHSKLIEDFGGTDGIRDRGMLESAVNTSLQTFDGSNLYPFEVEKLARLSYGLVMDHPFFDGNKRIAALVLDLGLSANSLELKVTDQDMIDEFIGLASGKITFDEFLSWIEKLSLPEGIQALYEAGRISKENGNSEMTLDEINEEIRLTREELDKKKSNSK